jgi:hypothetical protein
MALNIDHPLMRRAWVLLFGVAVLAFAGCATGAVDCSVGKPVGLVAALGAAALSFLDPVGQRRPE